jgi:hypothetical protein
LNMKKYLYSLASIVTAMGLTCSQGQSVTSPILGYLTLELGQGTNFVGFSLQPVLELQASVNVHGTDRARVFLQGGVTLSNGQFGSAVATTHVLELIEAGAGEGFHSVIANSLAVGSELALGTQVPAGVVDGAKVRIWKLWSLADVFGATNTAGLQGGISPEVADVILMPNGADFDRYYYSTGGDAGIGWRQVGQIGDKADVKVPYAGGFMIHTLSAKAVTLIGQVKSGKTRVTLQTGRNYLANLCPVNAAGDTPSAEGRTLGNSGLQDYLTAGRVPAVADLVLIWNVSSYTQYYYASGGLAGTGWRRVGGGTVDQFGVALPDGGFAIQRRGAPTEVLMTQGNF